MSRAFVKESDRPEPLPDIPLSEHPNRTTPAGLARQQARLEQLRAAAQGGDALPDELARQSSAREIRWLEARIAGAIVVDPAQQPRDRRMQMERPLQGRHRDLVARQVLPDERFHAPRSCRGSVSSGCAAAVSINAWSSRPMRRNLS